MKGVVTLKYISSDDAPAAIGPYSQSIETNGLLFISGQTPVDPADGSVPSDVAAQARQCCENVKVILDVAGIDFGHVVKTTCFLSDMAHFDAFNEVYASYFVSRPARSCVAVRELPLGIACEVEVIATMRK